MTALTQSIYFDDEKKELEEILIKNLPRSITGGNEKKKSNRQKGPTKHMLKTYKFTILCSKLTK